MMHKNIGTRAGHVVMYRRFEASSLVLDDCIGVLRLLNSWKQMRVCVASIKTRARAISETDDEDQDIPNDQDEPAQSLVWAGSAVSKEVTG